MAVNKKALNFELLKFAGFTCTGGIWSYPDGVDVDNGVPFFPESMDESFKWLWDKAIDYIMTTFFENIGIEKARQALFNLWLRYINKGNKSALAFCLAIKELIK